MEHIEFTLNGRPVNVLMDANRPLLWVLRTDFGLTGPKYGCGQGVCGACTVLVNDEPVRSCQIHVGAVANRNVLTIEGLARNGKLHPVQEAFVEHEALQCGFCTPGMILTAFGLLKKNPRPSEADVVKAMDDNLCRCGTYPRIVRAVLSAAEKMREGAS